MNLPAPWVDWSLIDATTNASGRNLNIWGYKASGRRFIENYKVVYAAAHAAQPDVIMGFNTSCHFDANAVHNLVKLDAKFDMFGVNLFANTFAIWPSKVKALEDYGLADKVYLTGGNFPMYGPDDAIEFAKHQAKYWVQTLQAFPRIAYMPECIGAGLENNPHIQNERVKPAWASYAAMTRLLGAGNLHQEACVSRRGSLCARAQCAPRPGWRRLGYG